MIDQIGDLKQAHMDIPIPDSLEQTVLNALGEFRAKDIKRLRRYKSIALATASLAAAFAIFVAGINISPTFAAAMSELPVIGNLVKVLIFREYILEYESYKLYLQVPGIEGMKNAELQNSLNLKYLEESKVLYEAFMKELAQIEANGGGNLGVSSGSVIKTDTEYLLVIGRYVVNTVGSSSTTFQYDTVDKVNGLLITLPSLFIDDRYIEIISENIQQQMIDQYRVNPAKFYWVKGIPQNSSITLFEAIQAYQNFYINDEGKLIISFDKYEVAPGSMGIVEFEIPTEVLSQILVSNDYLQ
jgi:hypothetical protein